VTEEEYTDVIEAIKYINSQLDEAGSNGATIVMDDNISSSLSRSDPYLTYNNPVLHDVSPADSFLLEHPCRANENPIQSISPSLLYVFSPMD